MNIYIRIAEVVENPRIKPASQEPYLQVKEHEQVILSTTHIYKSRVSTTHIY